MNPSSPVVSQWRLNDDAGLVGLLVVLADKEPGDTYLGFGVAASLVAEYSPPWATRTASADEETVP